VPFAEHAQLGSEVRGLDVISGDAVGQISKLKQEIEGALLVAGSTSLRLMVFPAILGRGKHLFPDGIGRLKLKLAEGKTVGPDGIQVQIYQRAD
jgi:hypothetical protein